LFSKLLAFLNTGQSPNYTTEKPFSGPLLGQARHAGCITLEN